MTELPTDLTIYLSYDGDLDAAARCLQRLTGAHSFSPGRTIPGVMEMKSLLLSLTGTPYEALEHVSPSLVAASPLTHVDEVDLSHLNYQLAFPGDPDNKGEFEAVMAFTAAIGSSLPTILVDGDFPEHPLLYDSRG